MSKQPAHTLRLEWSLPNGALQLSIPLPITADDANDIEELFALVMRGIRHDLIDPTPQPNKDGEAEPTSQNA